MRRPLLAVALLLLAGALCAPHGWDPGLAAGYVRGSARAHGFAGPDLRGAYYSLEVSGALGLPSRADRVAVSVVLDGYLQRAPLTLEDLAMVVELLADAGALDLVDKDYLAYQAFRGASGPNATLAELGLAARVLASPQGARLRGEVRTVTVLMSDLRGFTSLVTPPDGQVPLANQRHAAVGEQGLVRMGLIVPPQRIPDRLDRPPGLACDLPADVVQLPPPNRQQLPGPGDYGLTLLAGQLLERGSPPHQLDVLLAESGDCLLKENLPASEEEFEKQKAMPLVYEDVKLDVGYRLDLFVEERLVVEIKSVEALNDVHLAQVLTYLKLTGLKLGYLNRRIHEY